MSVLIQLATVPDTGGVCVYVTKHEGVVFTAKVDGHGKSVAASRRTEPAIRATANALWQAVVDARNAGWSGPELVRAAAAVNLEGVTELPTGPSTVEAVGYNPLGSYAAVDAGHPSERSEPVYTDPRADLGVGVAQFIAADAERERNAEAQTRGEITEGFWVLDRTDNTAANGIYKVQKSQTSGHLYAKMASRDGGFDYVPGAMRELRYGGAQPLDADTAAKFGKLYGVCCVCGRTLTNEASIEAGIGPICAGKQGWA